MLFNMSRTKFKFTVSHPAQTEYRVIETTHTIDTKYIRELMDSIREKHEKSSRGSSGTKN